MIKFWRKISWQHLVSEKLAVASYLNSNLKKIRFVKRIIIWLIQIIRVLINAISQLGNLLSVVTKSENSVVNLNFQNFLLSVEKNLDVGNDSESTHSGVQSEY